MEEKTVGGRSVEWLDSLNKNFSDSDGRKLQTTARFSQRVFEILEDRAAENGNSVAEEIRKAVRSGLQEGVGSED